MSFIKKVLPDAKVNKIIAFSRDELKQFEMQNEMMGIKKEMMPDLSENVIDEDGNEEEETELEIAKVMEEVGLDFKQKMGVNDTALPAAEKEPAQAEDDDALAARLAKLTGTMS